MCPYSNVHTQDGRVPREYRGIFTYQSGYKNDGMRFLAFRGGA